MRKALVIAVVAANVVLHAAPSVSLRISTPIQFSPGYQRLTLQIDPDARNREYCVYWEGGQDGSTCRQLEGLAAPRTQPLIELKDLPGGEYVAQAKVGRSDGTVVGSGQVKWTVRGPFDESPGIP